MDVLRHDLIGALEELEEGDEAEAHEIVEQHMRRAMQMRQALDTLRDRLDDHIDHLDTLALMTREPDPESIKRALDETRSLLDEDDELEEAIDAFEQAYGD